MTLDTMSEIPERPEDGRTRTRNQRQGRFLDPLQPLLAQAAAARGVNLVFPCFERVEGGCGWLNGKRHIVLEWCDYLGLADDPRVKEAAGAAYERFGTSRCASPLAGGYTELHRALEEALARFLRQDAAAVFASGYQANVGIITALVRSGDLVVCDLLSHASIVDGARLSGAEVRFFKHNTPSHLEAILERTECGRRVLVVVEGIYSMDGDIARLPDICAVAHQHGALVMIDEAHSFGVLGAGGRGAVEHFDMFDDVDVIMGGLSKALGSVGGFVAGSEDIIEAIRHSARALIFSVAPTPPAVAAALRALAILAAEPERPARLRRLTDSFRTKVAACGFDTMRSESPVVPIRIGSPLRTADFTLRLRERGVLVCPVVPPVVQSNLSRVRAHVTLAHSEALVDEAVAAFKEVGDALGLTTGAGSG